MSDPRSPSASSFLQGATRWLYRTEVTPAVCPVCAHDWGCTTADALDAIAASVDVYVSLLEGRDGMLPAPDGGWNATAYVWHLVDLSRSWSERWVQLQTSPGSLLVGWDPDVLGEARNYRALPTAPALWALREASGTFLALGRLMDSDTPFRHGDWGDGTVSQATVWLAHEFVHHQLDVAERAGIAGDAGSP